VQITGDHEAAVTVQCSERLARSATAGMFGLEVDDVDDEDVSDCVGEVANMTGGNVKSALEGSCQLSLPSVTTGRDYQVTVRGSRVTGRVAFLCDGELLVVSLLQRDRA
jgi:chemotaxis protein CheX